ADEADDRHAEFPEAGIDPRASSIGPGCTGDDDAGWSTGRDRLGGGRRRDDLAVDGSFADAAGGELAPSTPAVHDEHGSGGVADRVVGGGHGCTGVIVTSAFCSSFRFG